MFEATRSLRGAMLSAFTPPLPSPRHALLGNKMLSDSVCGLDVLTCVCCVRRSRRLDEWLFPASCRFAKHEPEPEARLARSPCVRLDVAAGADADCLPCRAWCAELDSSVGSSCLQRRCSQPCRWRWHHRRMNCCLLPTGHPDGSSCQGWRWC